MRKYLTILLMIAILGSACAARESLRYPPHRWMTDRDNKPIKMPKHTSRYEFLTGTEERKLFTDFKAVMGVADQLLISTTSLGMTQEAINVNNFDEVFDSTWFKNGIGRTGEICGPSKTPDVKKKLTVFGFADLDDPAVFVRDYEGNKFILRFDRPGLPGIRTGTEMISHMILCSVGYNDPDPAIVPLNPSDLIFENGAKVLTSDLKIVDMSMKRIGDLLKKISGGENKTIRALSMEYNGSRFIGPFEFSGQRFSDKNDKLPHEHRRELRGYRIFSAFLNNTNTSYLETFDTFSPVNGDLGYVTHYLFDLSSTFGNAGDVKDPKGLNLFGDDVLGWSPGYPNPAYAYQTPRDAFWAVRILSHFTDKDIDTIVDMGQLPDKKMAKDIADGLKARRDKLVDYWVSKFTDIDDATLTQDADGNAAINLSMIRVMASPSNHAKGEYRYKLISFTGEPTLIAWNDLSGSSIGISKEIIERMRDNAVYTLRIEQKRPGTRWYLPPIDIYIKRDYGTVKIYGLLRSYIKDYSPISLP
jgi:hypothetical protein